MEATIIGEKHYMPSICRDHVGPQRAKAANVAHIHSFPILSGKVPSPTPSPRVGTVVRRGLSAIASTMQFMGEPCNPGKSQHLKTPAILINGAVLLRGLEPKTSNIRHLQPRVTISFTSGIRWTAPSRASNTLKRWRLSSQNQA
jgi:hypothetical protein